MPPTGLQNELERTISDVAAMLGAYPLEAYYFLQAGLHFTAERCHGTATLADETADRHITGRQLCEGLRDFALERWGPMARAVLEHWNIRATRDFGRMVFAMIDAGLLSKQPSDTVEDFEGVYDFRRAFDAARYSVALPARLAD